LKNKKFLSHHKLVSFWVGVDGNYMSINSKKELSSRPDPASAGEAKRSFSGFVTENKDLSTPDHSI
ncbi:MAG: hypothetical protein ACK2TU_06970, partial [Anaerolineales bacterium]